MGTKLGTVAAALLLAAPLAAQYQDSTTVRTVVQCPAIPVDTLRQDHDSIVALLLRPAPPAEKPAAACATLLEEYRRDNAGFSGAVRKWAPTVAAVFAVGTFIAVLATRRHVTICPSCEAPPPEEECDDDDDH